MMHDQTQIKEVCSFWSKSS